MKENGRASTHSTHLINNFSRSKCHSNEKKDSTYHIYHIPQSNTVHHASRHLFKADRKTNRIHIFPEVVVYSSWLSSFAFIITRGLVESENFRVILIRFSQPPRINLHLYSPNQEELQWIIIIILPNKQVH